MYREYRDLTAAGAVTQCYRDMGARHRARATSIQVRPWRKNIFSDEGMAIGTQSLNWHFGWNHFCDTVLEYRVFICSFFMSMGLYRFQEMLSISKVWRAK